MHFEKENIYHVYNRGNRKQLIFYSERNYIFFLEKIKKYLLPHCTILAYCLMPNHFHILIHADARSEKLVSNNSIIIQNVMSEGIRMLLSSYAKAINKQEGKTGSLFQQKTKAKPIIPENINMENLKESVCMYGSECFNYIHHNPVKAGLVMKPEEWKYSSFNDYNTENSKSFCDRNLANILGVRHL